MRKHNFLIFLILILTCESEPVENPSYQSSENSAQEDQVIVENNIQTFISCLEVLETGNLSNLILDVYDNVEADSDDFHEIMIEAIEDIPNYQPLIDADYPEQAFNAQNYFGIYTYDPQSESWATSSSNSEITMQFPLFTNTDSNDSSITLSNFSEVLMEIEDPVYIPNTMSLNMSHNSQTMFAFNILNVDFTMFGEVPVPDDIDFNIYMNPFTHEFSVDKLTNDTFTLGYSLTNGSGGCVTQFEGKIKLLSTDYENLEDTDIDYIEGSITTNSMTLNIDIDAEYLFALDDPSVLQLNNFIDVEVFSDSVLLGELEVQENSNEDYYFNMVFIDGTVVNVENFTGIGIDGEEFIETLEGIFARYIDRFDDND